MWYDHNIKEYADLAMEINQGYCKSKGYDFLKLDYLYEPDRPPAWQKIPALIHAVQKCTTEYVMWIDADAHFNRHAMFDLEAFFPPPERWATFSEDISAVPVGGEFAISCNTGAMIFRKCQESLDFLHTWNDSYEKYPNLGWWEQGALLRLWASGEIPFEGITFVPYNVLQTFPKLDNHNRKALVLHYAGVSKDERVNAMRDYN
jgi:hypothetical protein